MATPQDQITIKATLDTTEFDSSLEGMKQEFAALEKKLGSSLLSPEDQKAVIARMGTLKREIDGLNQQIDTIARQSPFEQLVQATTPLVGAFTAAGSALQIFGVENEKLNEIINQTQALTIGLIALQDLSNLKQLRGLVALKAEKIKNFAIDKLTFQNTVKQTAANAAEATSKGAATAATSLATKAQLAWNAAITANPIGAIVVAIAALVAGIVLLVRWLGDSTEEFKLQKEAIDGTKFANDELLDRYNEHIQTLQDLDLEYQVIVGSMTEFEKQIADIDNEIKRSVNNIENEYVPALNELNQKYDGFLRKLWVGIKGIVIGQQNAILQETEKYYEELEKLNKEKTERIKNVVIEGEVRKFNEISKKQEDLVVKFKELQEREQDNLEKSNKAKLQKDIDYLNKRLDLFNTNTEKINSLLQKSAEELEDIQFEIRLFDLTETQKEIDQLTKQYKDFERERLKEIEDLEETKKLRKDNVDILREAYNDVDQQIEKQGNAYGKLIEQEEKRRDNLAKQVVESDQYLQNVQNIIKVLANENGLLDESYSKYLSINGTYKDNLEAAKDIVLSNEEILELELKLIKAGVDVGSATELYSAVLQEAQTRQQNLYDTEIKIVELTEKKADKDEYLSSLYEKRVELFDKLQEAERLQAEYDDKSEDSIQKQIEAYNQYIQLKIEQLQLEREITQEIEKRDRLAQLQDLRAESQRRITEKLNSDELEAAKQLEAKRLEEQKKAIYDYYEFRIQQAQTFEEKDILGEQLKAELEGLQTAFDERWETFSSNVRDSIAELSSLVGNSVLEIFSRDVIAKFDLLNNRLQEEVSTAQNSLDALRDADLISEQEYEQRSQQLQEEADRRQRELQIKQAQSEKRLALFQILIDTAIGIAKSWGQGGGLLGAPLAAIVAAQGALQAGLVASQPIPEFEMGGKIRTGGSHALGGSIIEAETGEFVVNKSAVAQPGVESLLNMINNTPQQQANQPMPTYYTDDNIIKKIIQETISGVASIPVTNLESEYTGVQRKVKSIETRSKF